MIVSTLFGSARDAAFSVIEVGAGINTIATMATAAIKPPTAIIPMHIVASRPRFCLATALRVCVDFALRNEWASGIGLGSRDPSARILRGDARIEQASLRIPSIPPNNNDGWLIFGRNDKNPP